MIVGADHRARQRDTCKQPFASRIRKYRRLKLSIGCGTRRPPDRARCGRGFRTDLEFILEQVFQTVVRHKQQHNIRRRAADLKSDTPAAELEYRRRSPRSADALADDTFAALPAD